MSRSEVFHDCFKLNGTLINRQTVLTEEGVQRLNTNGLVVIMAGFFPGGSGSSTTGRGLAKTLASEMTSSGSICRQIAEAEGYYGDVGLEEFLKEHRDDVELDNRVNAESFQYVTEEAKKSGVAVLDSKIAYAVWHFFSNTPDSPLFLTIAVLAGQKWARDRLFKRESDKAVENGLAVPPEATVFSSRRKRYLEDKYRYTQVYSSVGFKGAQTLATLVNFPPVNTVELSPQASAENAHQHLTSLSPVQAFLQNRKKNSLSLEEF